MCLASFFFAQRIWWRRRAPGFGVRLHGSKKGKKLPLCPGLEATSGLTISVKSVLISWDRVINGKEKRKHNVCMYVCTRYVCMYVCMYVPGIIYLRAWVVIQPSALLRGRKNYMIESKAAVVR